MDRILSAIFLVSVLLSVLLYGGETAFYIFSVLFIAAGQNEFYSMLEKKNIPCIKKAGIATGVILSLSFFLYVPAVIAVTGISFAIIIISSFTIIDSGYMRTLGNTLFGIFYVSWLGGHMLLLRGMPNGQYMVLMLFMIISIGDTAALYVGRLLGSRPLLPSISPKKTVEGAIGGMVGSISGVVVAKIIFIEQFSLIFCIFLGIIVSIAGQAGDLAESKIKRLLNVKDSGTIIPGHGGVLDRIDSTLFAAPLMYYCISYL